MNYDRYRPTTREALKILGEYLLINTVFSYLFYDSILAFLCGLLLFPFYAGYRRKELCRKRCRELQEQFQQLMLAVSGKIKGGMSAENAFPACGSDMAALFGQNAPIVRELKQISLQMSRSVPLEDCIQDLGIRSGVPEIYEFSQVFCIARNNSGRMRAVIEDTTGLMQEKRETEEEIQTLLGGKKLEQRLMCVIPLGIIFYLRLSAPEFLKILYHNRFGVCVMSVCLITYAAAFLLAERILRIRV